MKNNKLNLGVETAATFTAANGQTISYQDLFKGARDNMDYYANHAGKHKCIEDLKDAAQDSFLRIVRRHESYNPEKGSNPHGFGSRVAENLRKDAVKRIAKHEQTFSSLTLTNEDGDEFEQSSIADYRCDEFEADHDLLEAESVELKKERDEYLHKAMSTLKKSYRDVLELIQDDYTPGEIAETLGLKPNVAYIRIFRAKEALREALGPEFRKRFLSAA